MTVQSTEAGVSGVNQGGILGSELYCILQIKKMCFNVSALEIVYCANEHPSTISTISTIILERETRHHLSLTQPGASRM